MQVVDTKRAIKVCITIMYNFLGHELSELEWLDSA